MFLLVYNNFIKSNLSFFYFYVYDPTDNKFVKVLFGFIALLAMSYSAMRVAIVRFISGFIILQINNGITPCRENDSNNIQCDDHLLFLITN